MFALASPLTAWASQAPAQVEATLISAENTSPEWYEKKFETAPDIDVSALVENDFVTNGYLYTVANVSKQALPTETFSRRATHNFEFESPTNKLEDLLQELPAEYQYEDEDGFLGTLYLIPNTISVVVSETKGTSRTISETVVKDVEYNDESYFPETVEKGGYTLTRKDLVFDENNFMPDGSAPGTFSGTATYSKTVYGTKVVSYTVSAQYAGETVKEVEGETICTVLYKGTEIVEKENLFGGSTFYVGSQIFDPATGTTVTENPSSGNISVLLALLLFLLMAAVIALLVVFGGSLKNLGNNKIMVQAQNPETGEYTLLQKSTIKVKQPVIALDILHAPSSKQFSFTIPAPLANKLEGRNIQINAMNDTYEHLVRRKSSKDDYRFNITLND